MVDARLRILVLLVEGFFAIEIREDSHHAPSVPVVSDTATIVDMASSICQHLYTWKKINIELLYFDLDYLRDDTIYGPHRQKTCLQGFQLGHAQTSLLSYRD